MISPKPFSPVGRISIVEMGSRTEEATFEALFRRYYATVYGVLLRITGSPEEAEDLAQDVFLRLHERFDSLDLEDNVGGWLYRVASNTGFNAIRARQRRHRRLLRWMRLELPPRPTSPSAAEEVDRHSDAEMVREALFHLSERDRTVLILRYSGVSYAEIASAVGVKPSSVGTLLVRAEHALRGRFEALFPSPHER
ncbi:MAG TPA: sigma-70 family RNA polymerase sigma factor [Nitrolancea sp.]|nr:sigma-70 family RNA polymerase sigma factor [Nitrolancea sp.]